MSEEEQEAIKVLKNEIEQVKHIDNYEMGYTYIKIKHIEIFLNLIDKLQKENEELKKQTDLLGIQEILDNFYERKDRIGKYYISKDKIREKIEEVVEDELNQTNDLDRIPRFYARKILESLLEEE